MERKEIQVRGDGLRKINAVFHSFFPSGNSLQLVLLYSDTEGKSCFHYF